MLFQYTRNIQTQKLNQLLTYICQYWNNNDNDNNNNHQRALNREMKSLQSNNCQIKNKNQNIKDILTSRNKQCE